MTYNLQAALLAAATAFALSSSAASAQVNTASTQVNPASPQVRCDGGRTAGGECVDRELTTSARQSAVIFSQPKISHTAFPVLPSVDNLYRYPNQLIPDQLPTTPTGTPGPIIE
jgi:uncharacterized membrane protein